MDSNIFSKRFSSFRIIILGFMSIIFVGALLLSIPLSSKSGEWTSFHDALFTSTSAICVTGLVVKDTASYWSLFGQIIILLLIQVGGLGIVTVAAFIATLSGRKISLLERNTLVESFSGHQIAGAVKMTLFIFKAVFIFEFIGALVMLPTFIKKFGAEGIWMSIFHSVSAFCNAGFDIMGEHTGNFSSLISFSNSFNIVIPIVFLIIFGGMGFLTWDDIAEHKFHLKRYSMQTKTVLTVTIILILIPTLILFFNDFSAYGLKDRFCLSLFQAVTPRTAGFNTIDLNAITSSGRVLIIILMLIGGSPGSTAGGIKTTTVAVLIANMISVIKREKSPHLFRRRINDQAVKNAATLLLIYLFSSIAGALAISIIEGIPFEKCIFETASAIGTVGLSLGITTSIGLASHMILIALMFLGRVGGLTLLFAAVNSDGVEVSQYPVEKINVG